jgi:hypothetical protein
MNPLEKYRDRTSMDRDDWWRQAIMGMYILRELRRIGVVTDQALSKASVVATLKLMVEFPNG